jgi:NAD(P)-dependent dehydrogenase (short-subunit alcohol dehydrogenase family)
MVALNLVHSSNATLVARQPLVAVFIGGTSGIGAHTIRALAGAHGKGGKNLRCYILGRNTKAAEEIISDCQKACPSGNFRFIRANDLALMKDVDIVSAELINIEENEARKAGQTPKIDILVMTQAIFKPWDPRKGTSRKSVPAYST